jgi:hypothetical protein
MILPYIFPEKQTFGFDAQQIGHQCGESGSLDDGEELTQAGR